MWTSTAASSPFNRPSLGAISSARLNSTAAAVGSPSLSVSSPALVNAARFFGSVARMRICAASASASGVGGATIRVDDGGLARCAVAALASELMAMAISAPPVLRNVFMDGGD